MATLLAMCQQVARENGLEVPTAIVGASSLTAQRLLAAAQRVGKDLLKEFDWSALIAEHSITTANGTASYALPSDYDRHVDDTAWDRTNYLKMRGSLTPAEWQEVKGQIAATAGLLRRFRVKRDTGGTRKVFIDPTPTSADTLVIEYISNQWCEDSGGTGQSAWAADDDVNRLDDHLFELGIAWRVRKSLGLSFQVELAEFEKAVSQMKHQDTPKRVRVSRGVGDTRDAVLPVNLPDTNYGL